MNVEALPNLPRTRPKGYSSLVRNYGGSRRYRSELVQPRLKSRWFKRKFHDELLYELMVLPGRPDIYFLLDPALHHVRLR